MANNLLQIFWTQTFLEPKNFSGSKKCNTIFFTTKLLEFQIFGPTIFWSQHFLGLIIVFTKNNIDCNCFDKNDISCYFLWTQTSLDLFFNRKFCLSRYKFFDINPIFSAASWTKRQDLSKYTIPTIWVMAK